MIELTRTQILGGKYTYPTNLIKLNHTKHFVDRLENRGYGLEILPTVVRVTPDNIHSGKSKDGVRLTSVVVKLDYSSKWIFLCFNPYDGFLKTLWFKEKRKFEDRRHTSNEGHPQ